MNSFGNLSGRFNCFPKDITERGDPDSEATKIFCVNSPDIELNNGSISGKNVMIYLKNGGLKGDGERDASGHPG